MSSSMWQEAVASGRPAATALAAEVRAVEEGHVARVLADGSVLVKADSRPGSYRVRVRRVDGGMVRLACTCPSGTYRRDLPVPCKHAALAGRRLEREGLARWRDGAWYLRERAALAATVAPDRAPRPAPRLRALPGDGLSPAGHRDDGRTAGQRPAA